MCVICHGCVWRDPTRPARIDPQRGRDMRGARGVDFLWLINFQSILSSYKVRALSLFFQLSRAITRKVIRSISVSTITFFFSLPAILLMLILMMVSHQSLNGYCVGNLIRTDDGGQDEDAQDGGRQTRE